MTARDRRTLFALGGLALVLRLVGPLNRGLRFDEIWTLVDYGRLPFGRLLTTFGNDNNHPFYTLLAWLSTHALGENAWTLRLPAVLGGVLSVGALWLYARRVTSRGEALAASLLLATSYHHVWFSQDARGYTLLLALTLATTALFEELLAGQRRRLLPYAALMGLALFTHLGAIFVAGSHGLVALATLGRRERAARWLPLGALALAGMATLLLYAPMLDDMWRFFVLGEGRQAWVHVAWYDPWWSLAAAARSFGLGLVPGLAALALGLGVIGCGAFDYGRQKLPRVLLFLLPGALTALTLIAMGRVLWPRFFFQQAGFALLLLVRGLSLLANRTARLAIAARRAATERALLRAGGLAVAAVWLALLPRAWALPKQDFEGALAWITTHRRPGEVVLTTGLAMIPYGRYYKTDFVAAESLAALDARLAESGGGWVVSTLPNFLAVSAPGLGPALEQRGEERARFRGSVGDGDVVVYWLGRPAAQR